MRSLIFGFNKWGNKRRSKRFRGPIIKEVSSWEEFFALYNSKI